MSIRKRAGGGGAAPRVRSITAAPIRPALLPAPPSPIKGGRGAKLVGEKGSHKLFAFCPDSSWPPVTLRRHLISHGLTRISPSYLSATPLKGKGRGGERPDSSPTKSQPPGSLLVALHAARQAAAAGARAPRRADAPVPVPVVVVVVHMAVPHALAHHRRRRPRAHPVVVP